MAAHLSFLNPASRRFTLWPYAILAVLIRYGLVLLEGGFPQDRGVLRAWALTMRDFPLSQFYFHAPNPDHLPGDLIMLKGLELLYSGLGFTDFGKSFDFFARALPIGADVGCAFLICSIAFRLNGGPLRYWAALAYLFLPFSFALSGYWTSYDSVSLLLALAAYRLSLSSRLLSWATAGLFAAWGLLLKPQLIILLLPLILYSLYRSKGRAAKAAAFTILGLSWTTALSSLYGLGLWWDGGAGSLIERLRYAGDIWPYSTNGAPNIWSWFSVDAVDSHTLLGLSHATWGAGLFITTLLAILLLSRRSHAMSGLQRSLWVGAAAYGGALFFLTRVHGRYALPLLALLLIMIALGYSARYVGIAAGLLTFSFFLPFLYTIVEPWDYTVLRASSFLMGASLLMILALPLRHDIVGETER